MAVSRIDSWRVERRSIPSVADAARLATTGSMSATAYRSDHRLAIWCLVIEHE
jgi:hypothetical protein